MSDKTQVVVEIADGEVISVVSNRENVEVNIVDHDVEMDETFDSPLFTETWQDEDGKDQPPQHVAVMNFEAEVDTDRVGAVVAHGLLRKKHLEALLEGGAEERTETVVVLED